MKIRTSLASPLILIQPTSQSPCSYDAQPEKNETQRQTRNDIGRRQEKFPPAGELNCFENQRGESGKGPTESYGKANAPLWIDQKTVSKQSIEQSQSKTS